MTYKLPQYHELRKTAVFWPRGTGQTNLAKIHPRGFKTAKAMDGQIYQIQFFLTMRRRNLIQIFLHLHLNENLFEKGFLCTINVFPHLFTSRTPNESMNGKFVAIASNSSPDIEPSLFVSYILKTAFNGTISTACQQKQLEKRKQHNFKSAWPSLYILEFTSCSDRQL